MKDAQPLLLGRDLGNQPGLRVVAKSTEFSIRCAKAAWGQGLESTESPA